jgi:hypothetical protein
MSISFFLSFLKRRFQCCLNAIRQLIVYRHLRFLRHIIVYFVGNCNRQRRKHDVAFNCSVNGTANA